MKSYVARQPIFLPDMSVYGYELLYRDSEENYYKPDTDGDRATRSIVSEAITTFGMDHLTNNTWAFVNFTRALLLSPFAYLLPTKDFVIEILENVRVDEELIEAVKKLKEAGYMLALDDYAGQAEIRPLLDYVDIVKVDFKLTNGMQQAKIPQDPALANKLILAEKVETEADFRLAMKSGYRLFQGYFFARPTVFSKASTEISETTCVRAMREIRKPTPNFENLAEIIRSDINLAYKLLQRVNTLEYYRLHRVSSIKQALIRLGLREVNRWLLLLLMRSSTRTQTSEFVKTALIRGVFSEKVAECIGLRLYNDEAFMTGLFSMIDTIMEEDLPDILENVCVSSEVCSALLEKNNVLNEVLNLVIAYENGNWKEVVAFAEKRKIRKEELSDFYVEAARYADEAFKIS